MVSRKIFLSSATAVEKFKQPVVRGRESHLAEIHSGQMRPGSSGEQCCITNVEDRPKSSGALFLWSGSPGILLIVYANQLLLHLPQKKDS